MLFEQNAEKTESLSRILGLVDSNLGAHNVTSWSLVGQAKAQESKKRSQCPTTIDSGIRLIYLGITLPACHPKDLECPGRTRPEAQGSAVRQALQREGQWGVYAVGTSRLHLLEPSSSL